MKKELNGEERLRLFKIETLDKIIFIDDEREIESLMNGFEKRGNCGNLLKGQLFVYNREGDYEPHFHIVRHEHHDCCVKLLSNEYFIHGKHTGTLNNKEAQILYKWFEEDINNWLRVINEWNKHVQNETMKVPIDCPIPDYTKLNL